MDDRITLFAEVLLPIPVPGTFTYRVPYALNDTVRVGQRAVVQFGKTKIMSGLIVSLTEHVPSVEVKYLTDVLDDQPIVNERQLRFWDWVKTYYMCHPGEVMQAALPAALKLSSETTVALAPDYVLDSVALNDFEYLIVEAGFLLLGGEEHYLVLVVLVECLGLLIEGFNLGLPFLGGLVELLICSLIGGDVAEYVLHINECEFLCCGGEHGS